MPGALYGVDRIIDTYLQVSHGKCSPHYGRRSSYYQLSNDGHLDLNWHDLIRDVCDQIKDNYRKSSYRPCLPSKNNWQLSRRPDAAVNNKSREVVLERKILQISSDWYAQLATSSGLCGTHVNKRAAIDLILDEGKGSYQLIELKTGSDHPLKAAIEVLIYGALYIFSRSNVSMLDYNPNMQDILKATSLHLRVLAPVRFYDHFGLEWLAEGINAGLRDYLRENDFTMDFQFDVFPANFDARPPFSDTTVAQAVAGIKRFAKTVYED